MQEYFENEMRTSSSARFFMANTFVSTEVQLLFAMCRTGVDLEEPTSHDKVRMGDKGLNISGLSLARKKGAMCFLKWITSVIPDHVIKAFLQNAMKGKTSEIKVLSIIFVVYPRLGVEKDDQSSDSLENRTKINEIRRFANERFDSQLDSHRSLIRPENYSKMSKRWE